MGCNFCTTSEFFGGKGHVVTFMARGEDVYRAMSDAERELGAHAFFMMDENFLLYRKRALELLALMRANHKAWSLCVFSSANAIRKYTMRELVELGVEWIWLGLESEGNAYQKLKGTDTRSLVDELQSHGIRVLGSTIIGLEHHTPENIDVVIDHAVAHQTVFHQFMLYTPMPGTPLHREVGAAGRLLDDIDPADIHGQHKFNFVHAAISRDQSKAFLDRAFQRDYEVNGPSLYRLMGGMMTSWRRYRDDADARVRRRVQADAQRLGSGYGAALWAMERYLRASSQDMSRRVRALRVQIEREMGGWTPLLHRLAGPVVHWSLQREARFGPLGRVLEPRTFVDRSHWERT
jgi:radical SAM superfamily enzyme YgiQ (UPF0313 family)